MKGKKRPLTKQQKRKERLDRKARYGPLWEDIRTRVYQRDGFRCRACGRSKPEVKKLNAHHIILLRVSKSNDIRNLITLCDECHMEIEAKAIRFLKAGGHRRDIVRMTYRWIIEKRAKATGKILKEIDGKFSLSGDTRQNSQNTQNGSTKDQEHADSSSNSDC
jgi:hypothetical protein